MTKILLVGQDEALLEGLVQSLAALGRPSTVALSLSDARHQAARELPLVAVVDGNLADATGEALGIPLAPGGAIVLYRTMSAPRTAMLSPAQQRSVLADLTLPLERNRLVALVQHVEERARATGRGHRRTTPPETTPAI